MKENLMGYLMLKFHKNWLNNKPVGVIQSSIRNLFVPWLLGMFYHTRCTFSYSARFFILYALFHTRRIFSYSVHFFILSVFLHTQRVFFILGAFFHTLLVFSCLRVFPYLAHFSILGVFFILGAFFHTQHVLFTINILRLWVNPEPT